MGQRHQIFFILPVTVTNKEDKSKSNIVGLHNQWLFGRTALECLDNALNYIKKQDKYSPLVCEVYKEEAPDLCAMLYSVNTNTGYYHSIIHLSKDECTNPDHCDNDDGITIIDIRDKDNIKYCFMYLSNHIPIDANNYVEHYYGDSWLGRVLKDEGEEYKKNNPDSSVSEIEEHLKQEMKECVEYQQEIIAIGDAINSKASLLSPEEVAKIFPLMMPLSGR